MMIDMRLLSLILIPTITLTLSLSISDVYALTNVNNTYFSIDIPANWTYEDRSNVLFGIGIIALTPNEFGGILLNVSTPLAEQMKEEGAFSSF